MKKQRNTLRFTKMHGLGNDFVVINTINQAINSKELPIQQLADRHQGIGFDQLILLEAPKQADFFCRIFNADGSEAEQCGNGLRCVARLIHEENWHPRTSFCLETKAGIFALTVNDYDRIQMTMGVPCIQKKLIELRLPREQINPILLSVLSLGNPHAIVKVESLEHIPAETLGPAISAQFESGANVGFMQIIDRRHVRLRTFERGTGETAACGSNACAAAVAGISNGWLAQQVEVAFRHGSLLIEWAGDNQPIFMTGPATRVYAGEIVVEHGLLSSNHWD